MEGIYHAASVFWRVGDTQVLSVLEGYDITTMGQNSSELLHLYAESFQHAFADRAEYMGDPDKN